MAVPQKKPLTAASNDNIQDSKDILKDLRSNELIFGVVGPVGSGTSWIATALQEQLGSVIPGSEITILKASTAIENWANKNGQHIDESNKLSRAKSLQDAGDEIRCLDPAGVAVTLMSEIKSTRDKAEKEASESGNEEAFRVYILDSLKHPAEVALLRSVYQDAFCLIGVVCESQKGRSRLRDEKCRASATVDIDNFIARDQDSGITHGQKVTDTFHLADFFVDNSQDRFIGEDKKQENPAWDVNDQLGRLIDILTYRKVVRPSPSETGMFHAYGAQMTSACLSRQVGAALMDKSGNLVSTGKNEVPSAGGGVYGGNFSLDAGNHQDHRCAFTNEYCSSNRHQDQIIRELISSVPELNNVVFTDLKKTLKNTGIGRLLEFSRAVHAEMDALLSAARKGASPVGGKLFVTTFPCHYCARHIVSAGVDEVQYIEPYPKSLAFDLHGDAIAKSKNDWLPPSEIIAKSPGTDRAIKVLFRPFTGVAPRLYKQAFIKNRPLKDSEGNMKLGSPEWASGLLRMSYKDVENRLISNSVGISNE